MTLTEEEIRSIGENEAPEGAVYVSYSQKIVRIVDDSGNASDVRVYEAVFRKEQTGFFVQIDEDGNVVQKDYIIMM